MRPNLPLRKALHLFAVFLCLFSSSLVHAQVINTVIGGVSLNGKPATSVGLVLSMNGIVADNNDNLYFSGAGNSPIFKVDAATGIFSTFAGGGNPGSQTVEGAPLLSVSFAQPKNFATDNQGNVYLIDGNFRLIELNVTTGTCHVIINYALGVSSGDGGLVANASFTQLNGLAIDTQYSFARDRNFSNVLQASGPASSVSILSSELANGDTWIFIQMTTSDSCYTHLTATDSLKLTKHAGAIGIRNPDDSAVYIFGYPNPFTTSITITGLTPQKSYMVQVFNNLGSRVETMVIGGVQTKTLSTAAWTAGNYRIGIVDMTTNKRLGVLTVSKL